MNPETAREDVLGLEPGAVAIYDEPLKLDDVRDDLTFYPVPFDKLVAPICPDAKLRKLVRNMIYDGVLSRLLGIDLAEMERALARQLGEEAEGAGAQPGGARGRVRLRRREPREAGPVRRRADERDRRDRSSSRATRRRPSAP